jgi:hypothetical protein
LTIGATAHVIRGKNIQQHFTGALSIFLIRVIRPNQFATIYGIDLDDWQFPG